MPKNGLHVDLEAPRKIRGATDPPFAATCAAVLLHAGVMLSIWAWPHAPVAEPEVVVVSLAFLPALEPPVAPAPEPPEKVTIEAPPDPPPEPEAEPEPLPEETTQVLPEKFVPRIPPPPKKPAPPHTTPTPAPVAPPSAAPVPTPPRLTTSAPPRPATAKQPPYTAVLLAWLERNRIYPRAARMRGIEGKVVVRIALDRDGKLLGTEISRTSGHDILDEAAIEMVHRAAPFPPLLDAHNGSRFEFLVPVDFALQR